MNPSNLITQSEEIAELRARLEEAEETLRAIRSGEVDALVVGTDSGLRVFVLESAGAESSRFSSDILAKVNDAVIAVDEANRVIYLNAAAQRQYDVTDSEALGRDISAVHGTRWSDAEAESQASEALEAAGQWVGKQLHIKLDGGIIQVESSVSRLVDANGMPSGRLSVIRDITERNKVEDALRESEERYRTLFNSIDEGFCVIEMIFDQNGKPVDYLFLQTSPSFESHTGISDAVGRKMRDIVPFHEEAWFEIYGNVALTGESVRFVNQSMGLYRWYEVSAVRFGDPAKRQVAVLFNDITKRKLAEEGLRRNEQLFSVIIEQAPESVCVVDERLRILQLNSGAARVFAAAHPVVGRDLGDVLHRLWEPHIAAHLLGVLDQVLETGDPFSSNHFTEIRHDLGIVKSYDWVIRRLTLPSGRNGVVCYFTDVTERQQAEDALRASEHALRVADRSKDEFLAMLAHELRNPLAPLRTAAEILQIPGVGEAGRHQAQGVIVRQIENMSRMIDDLLDVSRITEGKIELNRQTVALQSILTHAASAARMAIEANGQVLDLSFPDEPIMLHADATRLEQVLGNLLGNACKYSGQGSRIRLSAGAAHGCGERETVIRLSDDGAGIDPEVLPRIFDLFVQGSRDLDREHGGLGIGLTIVQRLVKLHGGRIKAHSAGAGQGTEFIIHLPVLAAPPPVTSGVSEANPSGGRSLKILIVDDNQDSAECMAMLLQLDGHQTQVSLTGPDALQVAGGFLPEVVLLDIGLPGMDGYEVARQLRAAPATVKSFLIALTGYGTEEDRRRATEAGFDRYLAKPADLGLLRKWLLERV